jgi:hypothetical protein
VEPFNRNRQADTTFPESGEIFPGGGGIVEGKGGTTVIGDDVGKGGKFALEAAVEQDGVGENHAQAGEDEGERGGGHKADHELLADGQVSEGGHGCLVLTTRATLSRRELITREFSAALR